MLSRRVRGDVRPRCRRARCPRHDRAGPGATPAVAEPVDPDIHVRGPAELADRLPPPGNG